MKQNKTVFKNNLKHLINTYGKAHIESALVLILQGRDSKNILLNRHLTNLVLTDSQLVLSQFKTVTKIVRQCS